MEAQFEHLANNPDIIIATPGRLMHHILEAELSLSRVEMLVFDEADRLFELGFAEQLQKISESLERKTEARNEIDKTIQEFEALCMRIVESSRTLANRSGQEYRIDNDVLNADSLGLAYRTRQALEAIAPAEVAGFAKWGDTITALGLEDGWVCVDIDCNTYYLPTHVNGIQVLTPKPPACWASASDEPGEKAALEGENPAAASGADKGSLLAWMLSSRHEDSPSDRIIPYTRRILPSDVHEDRRIVPGLDGQLQS